MGRNQRKYGTGYKVQAVTLSKEIGSSKSCIRTRDPRRHPVWVDKSSSRRTSRHRRRLSYARGGYEPCGRS